jgi:IclR family transcriptional regulator, mhp operon transcriptional activator
VVVAKSHITHIAINRGDKMALFKPVSALERGLAVLAAVSKLGRARVGDVCDETELDKATIIRMLETLVGAGYVQKYSQDATYVVTGRAVGLGRGFEPHARLSELIGPILIEFRASIGWPSDFAIPDGDAMFLVETRGERIPLLWRRPHHFRPDLLLTSLGLAYIAFCCDEEQKRLLDGIRSTPHAEARKLLDNPAALRRTFARVRSGGYATGNNAYAKRIGADSLWGMGVPVKDHERVYGTVNILVVRSAMNEREGIPKYLGRLQEFARQVMEALESEKAGLGCARASAIDTTGQSVRRSLP